MIYLKHPLHGMKVAYLPAEVAADERNGWVRVDALGESAPVADAAVPIAVSPESPKRRGRPPKVIQ